MPWVIKKASSGGYKVCKKHGDKKCMHGKSDTHKMAQKRIIAASLNESFNDVVNKLLKKFSIE